jgi:predicted XRE-type DNA-binding protein
MSNKGQRFTSVWDAIEDTPRQAASMRARAELMIALQSWIKASGKTQAEAARLFGITQPRMSDMMRGKITLFSLDSMIDMATAAGLEPHVTIKKPKAPKKRHDEGLATALK